MTVFIQKGDAPLSVRQAEKRGQHVLNLEMKPYQREAAAADPSPEYQAWVAGWIVDNATNAANNQFNHQLAAYRKAAARLARYRLADGRDEVIEDRPTGETDEDGNPITEAVVIQAAIDPLEATVEQIIYDEEGNAATETVPNPAIVTDDAERAEAQALVDATPAEVAGFDG